MKKILSIFDGSNKFLLSDWQRIRLFQSLVELKPFGFTYLMLIIILILQNKISRLLFTFNENKLKIFCYIHWSHANANTLWLKKNNQHQIPFLSKLQNMHFDHFQSKMTSSLLQKFWYSFLIWFSWPNDDICKILCFGLDLNNLSFFRGLKVLLPPTFSSKKCSLFQHINISDDWSALYEGRGFKLCIRLQKSHKLQ